MGSSGRRCCTAVSARAADDGRYENRATARMIEMSDYGKGMQLAHEHLGKRPARFMQDESPAKLDAIRARHDPGEMLFPWMGRPA